MSSEPSRDPSRDPIDVGDALETLVHQFSDPWSFLRELIQNAIDAGSPEIDVRLEHQGPDELGGDDPGLMLVEVVDAGAGMDRQIIDARLTRLFSSAKDGDYTKIGRFGIGFVSVFAIDPDLVCVDTGRTGEYWRVLFRKDRSFQRIALDHPTEGTTIRIYKRAGEAEVEAARVRAREVLEYWCKHARVDVRIDDETISRPMTLGPRARCVVEHEEEGTRLVLGYVGDRQALRGYYHGGLTLHEERDDRLPHVAFKIDSRYIEHTLTRDNVIRDDNFEKAMKIVGELARTRLVEALISALVEGATRGVDREQAFLYERLLTALGELPKAAFEAAIVPAAAVGGALEALTLTEVRRRIKRTWSSPTSSPATEALRARGDTVLIYPDDCPLDEVLARHCGRAPTPVASVCVALPAPEVSSADWQLLRGATLGLLARQELAVADICLGHLAYPASPVAGHVAISQAKLGEITPMTEIKRLEAQGWFSARRTVVLNVDHPTVAHLLELGAREPELAAYLLLKLFYLRGNEAVDPSADSGAKAALGLHPERDSQLASAAAETRQLRVGRAP